jgi:hypothetical protein
MSFYDDAVENTVLAYSVREMTRLICSLASQIDKTPRWRVIKRYKLLETYYRLETDRALLEHMAQ